MVHSDVCGKIDSKSLSGVEYLLTFIDDKTRYVWVYVIRHMSEVFNKFFEWKSLVEKSLGKEVKGLHTINGGEFTLNDFEAYLRKGGIKDELTILKCPQQNGIAERRNRTLAEMVRSMLAYSEFTLNDFEAYLRKGGIKDELTILKCPQQNGIAERRNRTLAEMVRSMLAYSKLQPTF